MALFKVHDGNAKQIPPLKAGLERDIQRLFEKNLLEILNINFLASEYSTTSGGRIDTLGIDNNGSPAIIEYKRSQNDNVINQGLSYLKWLLDHRADFEKLVRSKLKTVTDDEFIDWKSPRVICVAQSYSRFDLDTVDVLPINIELFRYGVHESDILLVEPEKQQKIRTSGIKNIEEAKRITKEKIQYSLEDHLKAASGATRKLFEKMREKIIELDDSIIEEPKAKYIAYKLTTNFVDVVILKDSLKLFLNVPSGELSDPLNLGRDLTKPRKIGHWGNGDYEIKLDKDGSIDAVVELIKQSYSLNM